MNFNLDENMPRRVMPLLAGYGHDADTVADEGLARLESIMNHVTARGAHPQMRMGLNEQ